MKKFKLLSLLLIISLAVCMFPVRALALEEPQVTASSAIVMDVDTGNVLYEKNASQVVSPGALTTLMTALVVGQAADDQTITMEDSVTASQTFGYNLSEGSYSSGIVPGEIMSVNDLLYCGVLAAAMDAWNILAEHTAGSVNAFVDAMNAQAQSIGCTDTHFVNANGVAEPGQQTTARDLALIARTLTGSASVMAPYSVMNYTVSPTNMADVRSMTSSNAMMDSGSQFYYENAYGFRNDLIPDVGYAMVAGATYNDMDVIAVVLGSPDSASRYGDTRTLFEWAFGNFGYQVILSDTDSLESIPVEMGDPETVGVRSDDRITILMPNDQQLGQVDYDIRYQHEQEGTTLQAPVTAGEYLGEVTVYLDGVEQGTARLVASTTVDISRREYLRSELDGMIHNESVRQLVKVLVIALGVYILLVLFYLFQRLFHLHSLRRARKDRAIAQSRQELEWLDIPETEPENDASIGYFQDGYDQPAYDEGDYPPEEGYDGPGEYPEDEEQYPEEEGQYPEEEGQYPEEDGQYPEDEGQYPEEDGQYPEEEEQYPEDDNGNY